MTRVGGCLRAFVVAIVAAVALAACGGGSSAPPPSPTVASITASTAFNESVTINVLQSAHDPLNQTLAVTLLPGTVGGTATAAAGGTITFVPTLNYAGKATVQFEVIATDGRTSAPATATITVQAVPPVAANLTAATGIETPVTVAPLSGATDAAGESMTVALVGLPVAGTATVNSDQTVTFTPDAGFVGVASFEFQAVAADGGTSAAAAAYVTVQATARALVVTGGPDTGQQLSLVSPSGTTTVWVGPSLDAQNNSGTTVAALSVAPSAGTRAGRIVFRADTLPVPGQDGQGPTAGYTLYVLDLSQPTPVPVVVESGSVAYGAYSYAPNAVFAVSPDGTVLYYNSLQTGGLNSATFTATGALAGVRTLLSGTVTDFAVTAAGQRLIAALATSPPGVGDLLYSLPAAGGTATALDGTGLWIPSSNGPLSGAITGNGTGVLHTSQSDGGVDLYNTVTQAHTTLTTQGPQNAAPSFLLAPNGNALASAVTPDGSPLRYYALSNLPAVWSQVPGAPTQIALGNPGALANGIVGNTSNFPSTYVSPLGAFSSDSRWFLQAQFSPQSLGIPTGYAVASVASGQTVGSATLAAAGSGTRLGFTPDARHGLVWVQTGTGGPLGLTAYGRLYLFTPGPDPVPVSLTSDVSSPVLSNIWIAADSHAVAYQTVDGAVYVVDVRAPGHSTQLLPPAYPGSIPAVSVQGIWP